MSSLIFSSSFAFELILSLFTPQGAGYLPILQINISTVAIGALVPSAFFCLITLMSYRLIQNKEEAFLLSENKTKEVNPKLFILSDKLATSLPIKNKFIMRNIARKPISLSLLIIAVIAFSVMFILAFSLNRSSEIVCESQTKGHNYLYESIYDTPQSDSISDKDSLGFLTSDGEVTSSDISYTVMGFYEFNDLLILRNKNNEVLSSPTVNNIYISPSLSKTYGYKKGDSIDVIINDEIQTLMIADIAVNAVSDSIYVNGTELAKILNVSDRSYTTVLGLKPQRAPKIVTQEDKILKLDRDAVSNKTSAIINQVIGVFVGAILLLLAILLSFDSNIEDMMILHLLGYKHKKIQSIFIDVYFYIIIGVFVITLPLSILITQSVQKSLSIQTGDYIPFSANALTLLLIGCTLVLIYLLIRTFFTRKVKRAINDDSIFEYITFN